MTFGQKMEIRRRELGYTLEELARVLKTTQPYISRLENGHFSPSVRMIVKISTVLLVSADYLLFDEISGGQNA